MRMSIYIISLSMSSPSSMRYTNIWEWLGRMWDIINLLIWDIICLIMQKGLSEE